MFGKFLERLRVWAAPGSSAICILRVWEVLGSQDSANLWPLVFTLNNIGFHHFVETNVFWIVVFRSSICHVTSSRSSLRMSPRSPHCSHWTCAPISSKRWALQCAAMQHVLQHLFDCMHHPLFCAGSYASTTAATGRIVCLAAAATGRWGWWGSFAHWKCCCWTTIASTRSPRSQ